jgi:hypothetical protein
VCRSGGSRPIALADSHGERPREARPNLSNRKFVAPGSGAAPLPANSRPAGCAVVVEGSDEPRDPNSSNRPGGAPGLRRSSCPAGMTFLPGGEGPAPGNRSDACAGSARKREQTDGEARRFIPDWPRGPPSSLARSWRRRDRAVSATRGESRGFQGPEARVVEIILAAAAGEAERPRRPAERRHDDEDQFQGVASA